MLGEQIKKLRTQKKLTQQQLADYLHISPSAVGMWEKNYNEPDVKRLEELADFFGVTVDYLLGRETTTPIKEKTIEDTIQKLEEVTEQLKHIFRDQQ
ncbi:MAG: helix-turn-helix domain-containing protein [Oscillospiraceae bacterium]|nr:helix-turn-helix domain-containing protein [Oscillospiraceae bacterium]